MPPVDDVLLAALEGSARDVAKAIDEALQGRHGKRIGFALLVFSFNGPELTWVSNAGRDDMLQALREFIAKSEAGMGDELRSAERRPDRH